MKRRTGTVICAVVLAGLWMSAAFAATAADDAFDIILRRGTVYDGSGAKGFQADVGIRNGKIAKVGNLSGVTAKQDIDVTGLYVAPGFINIHSHTEASGLLRSENMITQGVTTEITNADGGDWPGGSPLEWDAGFKNFVKDGMTTNVGGYVGFNTVWEAVLGQDDRRPSAADIARMKALVLRGLQGGAFGLSAGLDYKPGYFATTQEVIQVAGAARDWRTNFPNHERLTPETDFSSRVGIAETIAIAKAAGLSPEITHMKAQGAAQGQGPEILTMMSAATTGGSYTPADVYPYLAGQTQLAALLVPGWAQAGGHDAMLKRFRDTTLRPKIIAETERGIAFRLGKADGIYLPQTRRHLTDLMRQMNIGAGEAVLRAVEESDPDAVMEFGDEADLIAFLKYPATAIACDCGSTTNAFHPRANGSFPRVLGRYVRETGVLTWEGAIRKMTGLPASTIGLVDRGFIAPGMAADVTVFDPATVRDNATYDQPNLRSTGIRDVLVNGQLVLRDGKLTGVRNGAPLRRSEHMPTRPLLAADRSASGEMITFRDHEGHPGARVLKARFNLSQPRDAHHALGSFEIVDGANKPVLVLEDFGMLQVAKDWASITGQARVGGATETVTIIIDKGDPMSKRPVILVDWAGGGLIGSAAARDLHISTSR